MKLTILSLGLLAAGSVAVAQMPEPPGDREIDSIQTSSIHANVSGWNVEKSGQSTGCNLFFNSQNSRTVSLSGCEALLPESQEWTMSAPNELGEITLTNAQATTTFLFVEAEHGGFDMVKPAYPLLTLIRN